jgi:Right handed beta helix region/Pel9A-like, right handed beta helix region
MGRHSTSWVSAAWRGLAVPLVLLALGIACNDDKLTEVSPTDGAGVAYARKSLVGLVVSPDSARLAPGQAVQFAARGIRRDSSTISVTVTWTATGGTINASGEFTAGATPGTYRVIAKNSTATLADTSNVIIDGSAPTITSISVSPSTDTLAPGAAQKFIATARKSDGATDTIPAKWAATGGTIDTSGVYVADSAAGAYQVIATQTSGSLADTATVTIAATSSASGPGCQSRCYWVATTGSDNNPGTSSAPFRTIQKAAGVVSPGDTVVVRDGVYTGPSGNLLGLSRAGTSSAWITFRAEHRWGAKLDGRSNSSDIGINFLSSANYNRVQGFELYGTVHGVQFYGGVQHAELIGNHVHHIGRTCTNTSNGQSAVFIGGGVRYINVTRNLIHDIGRYAPGENGCSPTNSNYENHDHGIYVAEANDVTISNNVLYNVKRGFMVQRYSSAGYVANNVWILNNTFGFPNPYRDAHITVQTNSTNLRIENNVFYDPLKAGINFASLSFSGLSVKDNLTFSGVTKLGSPSGGTFSGNMDNTDPLIMSASTPNFRLQAGSPAVDHGLTLSEVKVDFDAVTRAQGAGYDRGAYER